jgi:hypothetical protein
MFRLIQRLLRTLIVAILGGFTLLFLATAYFVFGVHSDSRLVEPNLAFWMAHEWSTGTSNDFYYLSQNVEEYGITDLYFHVGPINEDGSLASDLNVFTTGLNSLSTTNYAWIGQIRSQIDLEDPTIREKIIASSEWILTKGFDGIHVNIEPVRHNDDAFITLMQELRTSLNETNPEAKISVAMDEWQPHYLSLFINLFSDTKTESYWTSSQVKEVAQYADQMAVMTYDTNFHDPRLYSWWVEQQTVQLSNLMPENTELLIGIPSYETGESMDSDAENIETGITGFYRGATNYRSNLDKITGIAIYSYWEMDNDEWPLLNALNQTNNTTE